MNYCQIIKNDVANGPGIRLSLFVSGCSNHCEGCFQPKTWDPDYGELFTAGVLEEVLDELAKPYYTGITILGGDPFYKDNRSEVLCLVRSIRRKFAYARSIWLYTGYTFEHLTEEHDETVDDIISMSDVMVDGPFILSQKSMFLAFRGSENQRIIDLNETRYNENKPVIITKYERSSK